MIDFFSLNFGMPGNERLQLCESRLVCEVFRKVEEERNTKRVQVPGGSCGQRQVLPSVSNSLLLLRRVFLNADSRTPLREQVVSKL